MKNKLIKVIVGPRRAGKSVFGVQMLQTMDYAYVNFDDERLLALSDYDDLLKAIIEVYGKTKILFFDEIQNLRNWELFVNRLQRSGFNIVLTGSNANLLSQELATHLTGRLLEFRVFTFSFVEFLSATGVEWKGRTNLKQVQGEIQGCLDSYIAGGGYPEVVVGKLEPRSYLSTLFESILFKDVVKRHGVRYSAKLADLARYLVENHSREFTFSGVGNVLGFRSVHTVENYLSYLEEAFLFFVLKRFSYKARAREKSPRKIYGYDTGAVLALKFQIGRDIGRLLENLVAVELIRRRSEFYYLRNGYEVDFVIRRGGKVAQLVQVCYDLSDPRTRKREVSAIARAGKELDCRDLIILTWDEDRSVKLVSQTIRILPAWKWLLALA